MEWIRHAIFGCRGWTDHERDERGIWWFGTRCKTCGQFNPTKVSRFQDEAGRRALEGQP